MRLKSRKFWVSTVTAVVMAIAAFTGIELDPEQILAIVLPVMAYLLGQSWVDGKNGGR